MSYGILCRVKGCDFYAEYRVVTPTKATYLCASHTNQAKSLVKKIDCFPIQPSEHSGPEGMKSREEQKSEAD